MVVTGSAILDDWRLGISDIDLVMVIARPLSPDELLIAADLHGEIGGTTAIDGVYLTKEQLDQGPEMVQAAPQVVDGDLYPDQSGGELTWVTWRQIESGFESAVTDGGTTDWGPSQHRFPDARRGASRFSAQNLEDYWNPLGAKYRVQLGDRPADVGVNAETVQWIALGPARLVVTIETGDIVSKTSSAAFATRRWPEYADLLDRAVRSRAGAAESFTVADAVRALDLLDDCVVEGKELL